MATQNFTNLLYSCAISHQSAAFANQNKVMYETLRSASIHTSTSMSVQLVVSLGVGSDVRVEDKKLFFMLEKGDGGLRIVFPARSTERLQSMRGQLPSRLADLLNVYSSKGERQIHRIINELESGTDDILLHEEITRVSWLTVTSRPVTASRSENGATPERSAPSIRTSSMDGEPRTSYQSFQYGIDLSEPTSMEFINREPTTREWTTPEPATPEPTTLGTSNMFRFGSSASSRSGTFRPSITTSTSIPARIESDSEDSLYWKVLDHVVKQAHSAGNNIRRMSNATANGDDIATYLSSLTLGPMGFEFSSQSRYFGSEPGMTKIRIGAAGELFVSAASLLFLDCVAHYITGL